jgi:hypothetical protein
MAPEERHILVRPRKQLALEAGEYNSSTVFLGVRHPFLEMNATRNRIVAFSTAMLQDGLVTAKGPKITR